MENARNPSENANRLLDVVIDRLALKNDTALCRMLGVAPPVVSKLRHGRLHVGASMLIRMHEESRMSIRELKDVLWERVAEHGGD
jgi:DNA-binding transcriptional regulator YdaS (Cro superfamily)